MNSNFGRGTDVRRLVVVVIPFGNVKEPFTRADVLEEVANLFKNKNTSLIYYVHVESIAFCQRTPMKNSLQITQVLLALQVIYDRCLEHSSSKYVRVDLDAAKEWYHRSKLRLPRCAVSERVLQLEDFCLPKYGRQTTKIPLPKPSYLRLRLNIDVTLQLQSHRLLTISHLPDEQDFPIRQLPVFRNEYE